MCFIYTLITILTYLCVVQGREESDMQQVCAVVASNLPHLALWGTHCVWAAGGKSARSQHQDQQVPDPVPDWLLCGGSYPQVRKRESRTFLNMNTLYQYAYISKLGDG